MILVRNSNCYRQYKVLLVWFSRYAVKNSIEVCIDLNYIQSLKVKSKVNDYTIMGLAFFIQKAMNQAHSYYVMCAVPKTKAVLCSVGIA